MQYAKRKKIIAIISGVFLGLLILFTLFSNTLMSLTLPKVALVTASRGDLSHEFQSSGVLKWKAETELNSSSGWKVKKVMVKKTDVVQKGQTLITYDSKDINQQIKDEQGSLAKLKLSTSSLQYAVMEAMQGGDEKTINDATTSYKSHEIDIETQQRRIQKMRDDVKENSKLVAPFAGMVTKVNAIEGFPSSGPDVMISNQSLGLSLEISLPAPAVAQLKSGDELDVQVNGKETRQVKGQIENIQEGDPVNPDSGESATGNSIVPMKKLLLSVQDPAAKEGEVAQVDLTQTLEDVLLVPNAAIHDEGGKKYVFGIEQKDGPLGNAFYVRKVYVTVDDANASQSAVTGGLFDQESIIIESSEPLQEGDKIRM
ncbi:efflux RND transporter periplasmic adaptor subunit [Bacillus sp. FJAT-27264]|uniref:efflux RND transporter periplasmic adaptor subunit n=1 Tax=Paenibacillus sp. (strain DSM 101736 / FJAT-27264) TaxID=1850362 RepID=UPI000A9C08D7|nr:efflux RND transporter periplasmic adaptor subunit [Bacillus sp. FJAT-27264]